MFRIDNPDRRVLGELILYFYLIRQETSPSKSAGAHHALDILSPFWILRTIRFLAFGLEDSHNIAIYIFYKVTSRAALNDSFGHLSASDCDFNLILS